MMKPIAPQLPATIGVARHLPTLPHVLLKLIEACNRHPSTTREIFQIISSDPSLSAGLMKLVNSVYNGPPTRITSIEQAILVVGKNSVKNLAISASVHQVFNHLEDTSVVSHLRQFWWHSLTCATLSKLIAEKVAYSSPHEAYLSGLLHDIGKLTLGVHFERNEHAEKQPPYAGNPDWLGRCEKQMGATHAQVGAWMVQQWKLQSFMADAVLYHHEPVHRIVDALPLVKIVFVANALCPKGGKESDVKFKTAEEVFGFTWGDVEQLMLSAEEKVKRVATSLDIGPELPGASHERLSEGDAKKQSELLRAVREISLLQGTIQNAMEARGEASMLKVVTQGLQILFDVRCFLFFPYDREKDALVGKGGLDPDQDVLIQELVIPVMRQKSLLAKSLSRGTPLDSFGRLAQVEPSIVDQQIIRLLGTDGILCLPMVARREFVGVIVLGVDGAQCANLLKEANLLNMFVNQAALAVDADSLRRREAKSIESEGVTASSAVARKVAHEVSNPLGIIKNYLRILGHKLSEDNPAQEDIRIINEEIDRVASIIRKLYNFSEPDIRQNEPVDINALISDLVKITHESLLQEYGIRAHLGLEPSLPPVMTDKNGLKQVLINLIKNAVEAMPNGGNLYVTTRSDSDNIGKTLGKDAQANQQYVETTIRDDGPGIPEVIKARLFEPFITSKGKGHAGLGLSIAHSIVRELNGTIICESDETLGTTFRIVLPVGNGDAR